MGFYVELMHKVLWLYYTSPYSSTKEIPFIMVYGVGKMNQVELNTSTWWRERFSEEDNQPELRNFSELI